MDLRLAGTGALTWRRLRVHVVQAARDPATALYRSLAGEWAQWDTVRWSNVLASAAVDTLRLLSWQQSGWRNKTEAEKNRPDPILLPGQEPQKTATVKNYGGGTVLSIADARERLGR